MIAKYAILFAYFAILFVIGVVASRRIESLADFYVGGKKLGYWVVAFSARATGESAWLLLGLTGMGALVGLSAFWVVLGEVLGVAISWFLMAKRFKRQTDAFDSITIPDYLVSRLGPRTHTLRILAATALSVFVTIYVSAQIDATGKAFESFLSLNYYWGILLGFGIVVVYIYSGGFIAVAWSDLFQGLMMLGALVVLPIVAFVSLPAPSEFLPRLAAIEPGLASIWGKGGFSTENLFAAIAFLAIGVGFLGAPQVYVRFMAIKSEAEIAKGAWVAIGFTILTDSSAVLIGMLGRLILTGGGQDAGTTLGNGGEHVLPLLVNHLFGPLLIGIYIAAVLSAIMSTVDSLLIVASSALTRDFYEQILHPEIKQEALAGLSRKVTLLLAFAALALALVVSAVSPTRTVFWFAIFGWNGIAAVFCPVIVLSLFWRGYSAQGAIASMVTGFVSVPLFKFGSSFVPTLGPYLEKLSELPPSLLLASAAGVIFSVVFPPEEAVRNGLGPPSP